jgi:UDP-N-acetylmuramoylalanine-D-glutamate ligase
MALWRITMPGEDVEGIVRDALRQFPGMQVEVVGLARHNAAFRDMCQELSDALRTHDRLRSQSGLPSVKERLAECEGWIDRLTREMEAELRNANVVRLSPQYRGAPR